MIARLRTLMAAVWAKAPARILVVFIGVYLLFGWFGFEPLVKWAVPKFVADKSGHHLAMVSARFDPLALSVRIKGLSLAEPDGKPLFALDELFVDLEASGLLRRAFAFEAIDLVGPDVHLVLLPDGRHNWTAFMEAFKSDEEDEDKDLPRLLVDRIALAKGQVHVTDHKHARGHRTDLHDLHFKLTELSTLPDDKGTYTLSTRAEAGARIRWKGRFSLNPMVAVGDLMVDDVRLARVWPYVKDLFDMAVPEGVAALGLNYRVAYGDERLSLTLDDMVFRLAGLKLRGRNATEPEVALDSLEVSGARFDLQSRRLDIPRVALQGGRVHLERRADGTVDLADWLRLPEENAAPGPQADPGTWAVDLGAFQLDGLGLRYRDAGFAAPLGVEVGNVKVAFRAQAQTGAEAPRAEVEGLGVDLSALRLTSGALPGPLLVLDGLHVEGGRLDLAARDASVSRLALVNGRVEAERDAQGRIALVEAFRPASKPDAPPDARATAADGTKGPQAPWKYRLDHLDMTGFEAALRDLTTQPATGLTLQQIQASVSGLSQDLGAALPVRLSLRVKEGGAFQADGKVVPGKASADLRLKLSGLSLKPAQPYVSQAANLTLASGTAAAAGRLRYGKQLEFRGGFQVTDLLLNETEGGARFLAWKRLESDSVSYRPEALDIEELKLDGLGAKLVVYEDKTVNLKRILKPQTPPPAGASSASAKPADGKAEPGKAEPATRMTIDRIRVENGELDFADLSLALPFGTRIHGFHGAFNGISTQPGTAAQLELDGQVDEYGLARAVGQIDLFDPTAFMDIKAVFRNVEMTRLTPYTATFVGRQIASGKLSLDLEYKIKDRQLLGENQIIMDRLTLGERVESPTAKDLPLDLAIAILEDSNGRIDLGLPVSGSLDDPQFSYGRIIWKAIGNIIAKIVTAPFRALAGLFGGNGDKLETIAFEPGEAVLTPPEKEKLKQIATVLDKRPGLALTVHPAWSAEIDRPVVRETRLRRAVAERMGLKLRAEEEPGPISTANAKVQTALESLYAARFGDASWQALQAKWFQANPESKKEGGAGKLMSRLKGLFKKEEPLSEADMAALKGSDLHALLYGQLLMRETVTDADLQSLARRRGETIVAGLAHAGAPAARITLGAAEPYTKEGREVSARMTLEVAKRPSPGGP